MRWFIILGVVLLAALALQAGLMAFAMYVLLGVLLLSRHLAKSWGGSIESAREVHITEPIEAGQSTEGRARLRNAGNLTIAWAPMEDLLHATALGKKPART